MCGPFLYPPPSLCLQYDCEVKNTQHNFYRYMISSYMQGQEKSYGSLCVTHYCYCNAYCFHLINNILQEQQSNLIRKLNMRNHLFRNTNAKLFHQHITINQFQFPEGSICGTKLATLPSQIERVAAGWESGIKAMSSRRCKFQVQIK